MLYTVVQRDLEPPTAAQLEQAFLACPSLTRTDAIFAARHGYGVIADGLAAEDARALQQTLEAAGVPAAAIPADRLPALPPSKRLKRADCTPEALVLYDTLGRPVPLAWDHVTLLAAGAVERLQQVRRGGVIAQTLHTAVYHDGATVQPDRQDRFVSTLCFELFLDVEPYRYQAQSDEFLFMYLGDRRKPGDEDANFRTVIADLQRFAPRALVNRGAAAIASGGRITAYRTRQLFEREILWLFWWMNHGTTGTPGVPGTP